MLQGTHACGAHTTGPPCLPLPQRAPCLQIWAPWRSSRCSRWTGTTFQAPCPATGAACRCGRCMAGVAGCWSVAAAPACLAGQPAPRLASRRAPPCTGACLPSPAAPLRLPLPAPQAADYIGLQGNELRGALPPEWGRLSSLQLLDLGRNKLGPDFPAEWGSMRGLKALNLVRLVGAPPRPGGPRSWALLFSVGQLVGGACGALQCPWPGASRACCLRVAEPD